MVLSSDPDASSLPSGENATALTHSKWPSSVCNEAPMARSQSLIILSDDLDPNDLDADDPDANNLLSGENVTALTEYRLRLSVCNKAPVAGSESLMVLSYDLNASSLPFGENATALTGPK
jgi:hypothetical protein